MIFVPCGSHIYNRAKEVLFDWSFLRQSYVTSFAASALVASVFDGIILTLAYCFVLFMCCMLYD
jgi:uncharacterized protein (UPF0548 family)